MDKQTIIELLEASELRQAEIRVEKAAAMDDLHTRMIDSELWMRRACAQAVDNHFEPRVEAERNLQSLLMKHFKTV
jgi:hypothetical protein